MRDANDFLTTQNDSASEQQSLNSPMVVEQEQPQSAEWVDSANVEKNSTDEEIPSANSTLENVSKKTPSGKNIINDFPLYYKKRATPYVNVTEFSQQALALGSDQNGRVSLRPCKVIIIGNVAVGKTSIIKSLRSTDSIAGVGERHIATIDIDFIVEHFKILGQNYSLDIWDTAGQERYEAISEILYRSADVILVTFDMTNLDTLKSARSWLDSALAENIAEPPILFLVGTKADKCSGLSFIFAEEAAITTALELKAEYWAVSSYVPTTTSKLFKRIAAMGFDKACRDGENHIKSSSIRIGQYSHTSAKLFDEV